MSRVTCHMSHVTCHLSPVTCHMSHFFFFLQNGEVSQWRVCYQRGLPRLVLKEVILLRVCRGLHKTIFLPRLRCIWDNSWIYFPCLSVKRLYKSPYLPMFKCIWDNTWLYFPCLNVKGVIHYRVCHDIKKSKPRRGPMVSSCTLVLSIRIDWKNIFFSFITYPLLILKKNLFCPFWGISAEQEAFYKKKYFLEQKFLIQSIYKM